MKKHRRVWVFLALCGALGVLTGVTWALTAPLPHYVINEDLSASMSELQMATIFASDAVFAILAGVIGLVVGLLCWLWFNRLGWWVTLMALAMSVLTAVFAWQMGVLVAPSDFKERLARAVAGDVVPMDLALHSYSALVVAPLFAMIPIMVFSAFTREAPADTEEPVVVAD